MFIVGVSRKLWLSTGFVGLLMKQNTLNSKPALLCFIIHRVWEKRVCGIFDTSLTDITYFYNFWHELSRIFTSLNCWENFFFILSSHYIELT